MSTPSIRFITVQHALFHLLNGYEVKIYNKGKQQNNIQKLDDVSFFKRFSFDTQQQIFVRYKKCLQIDIFWSDYLQANIPAIDLKVKFQDVGTAPFSLTELIS